MTRELQKIHNYCKKQAEKSNRYRSIPFDNNNLKCQHNRGYVDAQNTVDNFIRLIVSEKLDDNYSIDKIYKFCNSRKILDVRTCNEIGDASVPEWNYHNGLRMGYEAVQKFIANMEEPFK